jgi:hypothetical protein
LIADPHGEERKRVSNHEADFFKGNLAILVTPLRGSSG